MPVTKVRFERFTAFKDLEVEFSPGINALVGENGTGKTHLMKACYAACDALKAGRNFPEKLISVYLPYGRGGNRLVHREHVGSLHGLTVRMGEFRMNVAISGNEMRWEIAPVPYDSRPEIESVYIPVKEMLANAPGFLSLLRNSRSPF